VKNVSVALVGLFVVTIATPASADDAVTSFNRNQARYDKTEKYILPPNTAALQAKLASNYADCQAALRELSWNYVESFYYCSWRHGHMNPLGGRAGKALVATGFGERANAPVYTANDR
jgi:hypothetical protein